MSPEPSRPGAGRRHEPPPRRPLPPDDPRSGYPQSPPKDPSKDRVDPRNPGPLS